MKTSEQLQLFLGCFNKVYGDCRELGVTLPVYNTHLIHLVDDFKDTLGILIEEEQNKEQNNEADLEFNDNLDNYLGDDDETT